MASIKDLKRMCEMQKFCADCPLSRDNSCMPDLFPDNADEIVDKWVQEHPVKTYADDFFGKFPDAQRKAAADVQPVVRAEWVCLEAEIGFYSCSKCEHNVLRATCNYCPNCGARMDGGK